MSAVHETTAAEAHAAEPEAQAVASALSLPLLDAGVLARAPLAQRAAAVAALQRSAGNGAVSQMLMRAPAENPDLAGWKDKPFGELLFKKINEEYTPTKLLQMALPQLTELPKQMPDVAVDGVMDAKNVKSAAGGVAAFAQKAAEEWMKSADGKAFLAKAATWVNQHPNTVYWTLVGAMTAAIAAAAILYFSGQIDPPELKKKFEALGFKFDAAVDVGKFTEVVLQSAKLSVSHEIGAGVSATISGDVKDDAKAGWSGTGGARLGTKDVFGTYQLKWDEKGDLGHTVGGGVYGLTGQYGFGAGDPTAKVEYKLDERFTAAYGYQGGDKGFQSGSFAFKPLIIPIETTAMVKFNADGSALLDASALYKSVEAGTYKLGMKGPLAGGKPDEAMMFTFGQQNKDASGASASAGWSFNPVKPQEAKGTYDFSVPVVRGLTLTQAMKVANGEVTSYDTKLEGEALKGAIKAALGVSESEEGKTSVTGSVAISRDDATLAVHAALTDGQLQDLGVKMGLGGKDDAVKFLVDMSVSRKDGIDKLALQALLTTHVGKLATQWEVKASDTSGKAGGGSVSASGAFIYTLPKGVLVGGTAGINYSDKAGTSVSPGVLVGHEWSPVMLKGSVAIPIGGDGPPVWGLSAVGKF